MNYKSQYMLYFANYNINSDTSINLLRLIEVHEDEVHLSLYYSLLLILGLTRIFRLSIIYYVRYGGNRFIIPILIDCIKYYFTLFSMVWVYKAQIKADAAAFWHA
ncbi:hypothetical protein ACJX0J_020013, partial [Zea mays]